MDPQKAQSIIEKLRANTESEQLILKEEFMAFREVLMKETDRNRFVGKAQKGGNVIFYYEAE